MRALQDNKAYDLRSSCRVVSRKVSERRDVPLCVQRSSLQVELR